MKILLIEDNPDDVVLIKRRLSSQQGGEPVECEVTGTLKEALACLGHGGIDLVLTDLTLPDAKGLEAVVRLRKDFPQLSCVVLTGSLQEEQLGQEAVRAGAQDYLFKEDLNEKHTIRSLRYALERHRLLLELEEKNRALERMNKVMLQREERILELKGQLKQLEGKLTAFQKVKGG